MGTITLGVDLAKQVFSVCEMDAAGRVLRRHELRREAFAAWLGQQPAGAVVAMEACSGAHHWARRCLALGLQPKVIAAQFVGPFRKSRTTKNDRNDAEAIATARHRHAPRVIEGQHHDRQWSESLGQKCHAPRVDRKSPKELLGQYHRGHVSQRCSQGSAGTH